MSERGPFSIEFSAKDVEITRNVCRGGIRVADRSSGVRILENRIEGGFGPGVAFGGVQKVSHVEVSKIGVGVVAVEIKGNVVAGNADNGICTLFEREGTKGVRDLSIEDNLIQRNVRRRARDQAIAWGGIVLERTTQVRIRGNDILENGIDVDAACG